MKPLTRQRRDQIANVANGKCAQHKHRPIAPGSTMFCEECVAKRLAAQPPRKRHPGDAWLTVDWSLHNKVIAEQIDVTQTAVRKYRKLHNIPEVLAPSRQRWLTVDWSKTPTQIAEEMGVTLMAVLYQKKKVTKSTCANKQTC